MKVIDTFRKAGVKSIVISFELDARIAELEKMGCEMIGESKVFRRETTLYDGKLEILKGIKLSIQ